MKTTNFLIALGCILFLSFGLANASTLTLNNPTNGGTYYSSNLTLNYTLNSAFTTGCWYSFNSGATNTTIAGCQNITFISNNGSVVFDVYNNNTILCEQKDYNNSYALNNTCKQANTGILAPSGNLANSSFVDDNNEATYSYPTDNQATFILLNYTVPNLNVTFNNVIVQFTSINETGSIIARNITLNYSQFTNSNILRLYLEQRNSSGAFYNKLYAWNYTSSSLANVFSNQSSSNFNTSRIYEVKIFWNRSMTYDKEEVNYSVFNSTFTIYAIDEDTQQNLSNFSYSITNLVNITLAGSTTTGNATFNRSALPNGIYTIVVSSPGFYSRTYENINTVGDNLTSYLLNSSLSSTLMELQALNEFNNNLHNALIVIQRNINNTYVNITQVLTDSSGLASVYLKNGQIYNGIGIYSGYTNIVQSFQGQNTPQQFIFGSTTVSPYFYWMQGYIKSGCTRANTTTTRTITCFVNDTASIVTSAKLVVNKLVNLSSTNVCSYTNSAGVNYYFTLQCSLPMTNGTYDYYVVAYSGNNIFPLDSGGVWRFDDVANPPANMGAEGLLIALILILTCGILFLYYPPIGIFMTVLVFDACVLFGLIRFDVFGLQTVVSFNIIGAIVMILVAVRD